MKQEGLTNAAFSIEVTRMRRYFTNGEQVFHPERLKLIWPVVKDLPEKNFRLIVDFFIGNFHPDWPPKLADFQEKAQEQRKLAFRETAQIALGTIQRRAEEPGEDGLKKALADLGVKSLVEAIQKRKTGG
jgi:hypothetical protein